MSVLVVNNWVEFNALKQLLGTTDGNLASHLKALEEKEFVNIKKQFIDRKPRTSYQVSETGRELFARHIEAQENLIKGT